MAVSAVACERSTWRPMVAVIVIGVLAHHGVNTSPPDPVELEVCERESFTATCPPGAVIMLHSALYGRMRVGRCIEPSYSVKLGCKSSVLREMDKLCSGRHHCDVEMSYILQTFPEGSMLCLSQLRGYLEASYSCVPVANLPSEECANSKLVQVPSSGTHGYIASIITEETSCGSYDHPWLLSAPPGQTIQLTLHYFAADGEGIGSFVQDESGLCTVYAVIKEEDTKSGTTLCAQNVRSTWAHSSEKSDIQIRMRKNTNSYFLLEYEVVGCPNIVAPAHGWVERVDNVAMLGCNASRQQTWRVTCQDGGWVGQLPNCSAGVMSSSTHSGGALGVFTGSQWVAIVIILAIAVTLGLVIFLFGLLYLRRKRNRQVPNESHYSTAGLAVPDYYSANHPHYAKTMSVAASDGCSSTENDYYRTWQLQRHPAGSRPHTCPIGSHTSAHGHSSPYDQHPTLVEHIYESPKFERKDYSPVHAVGTDLVLYRGPTQYFELDPSVKQNQQSE